MSSTSTDQGLKPIPPAATQIGDSNGHYEISEPNFSATKTCRGCSPVVEMTASGWLDSLPEEQHGTTPEPVRAIISAGPSNRLISQAPSGGDFIIGGTVTVRPGQTATIDNTPIAVQTTAGRPEVIIGTEVIPLTPSEGNATHLPLTTHVPMLLPPVLILGSNTIFANPQSQYIISGQTLSPEGPAIIVSGTTILLSPSATAFVINGETSSLAPSFGFIFTTAALALTFKDHVYTVNCASYIIVGPETVLKPGGVPVTVDGTTLSLDHSGTAIVVQGSTSLLQPVSTVVTLTRSLGSEGVGNSNVGYSSGGIWVASTGKPQVPPKPVSGAWPLRTQLLGNDDWLGGLFMLLWWILGCLAVVL